MYNLLLNPNLIINNDSLSKRFHKKEYFNLLYNFKNLLQLGVWLCKYIRALSYTTNTLTLLLFNQTIQQNYLLNILTFLKYSTFSRFKVLSDIVVVDNLFKNNNYRYNIYYMLLSISLCKKLTLKLPLQSLQSIQSITSLYDAANWLEREIYDMFGIFFKNHPDFRRILTDYGFTGHPLKKDFPVFGFYETFYDLSKQSLIYKRLELTQYYRLSSFF